MKSIKQFAVILWLATMASGATAQITNIILQTDFDGDAGEGNYNNDYYGYCVAGSSAGSVLAAYTGGIMAGVGVGGTSANYQSPDYTLLPSDPNWTSPTLGYVYAVLGNGTKFGAPMTAITPTAVLDSFILTADLQVSGLVPSLNNADVMVKKVQFIDSGNNVIFDFTGDAGNVGTNFAHIAIPLSALSYASDATHPLSDFTNAAVISSISSFTIEFGVQGLPVGVIGGTGDNLISPPFGFTDTGSLVVDNIELVQTGNTVPTPMQEQVIWQADFDNTFPNANPYGTVYSDVGGTSEIVSTNMGGGFGGSNSLECTADFSSWSANPPTSYSGFGPGAVENPLPFVLTSSNKASYRVYIAAKAGGIVDGASTNIQGSFDLLFKVPAGAESPSNASPAVVFDLNPSLTLTTNWQSYVFDNMPIGVNNGGSQALFNQYISQVNQMQVQLVAQGNPNNIATQFGYDNDNTVDIDNIKVVQLVPGLPPVSVTSTAGQVKVYWADPTTGGVAQLLSSTNVAGPYLNVAGAASGAASPYTVPSGSAQQFFKTVWVH
jgi:hypothetical protein